MFTQREIRIDDTYYKLCAAFNKTSRMWDAYILKEGEWFAYVSKESCADAALRACNEYMKGVTIGNATN